jgi:hypothetical protein
MNKDLNKFVNACTLKGEYEEIGDSKNGNKQYKTIHSIYLLLKKENRLDELIGLLDHENPYVRSWAAGYTLQISPLRAEKILEELADIKSKPVGFNAEMTLREWRKGNLKF